MKKIGLEKLSHFDVEKHVRWLIQHQDGGWEEYITEKNSRSISPQVTAQGIIGLLPFLNDSNFVALHSMIRSSIEQTLQFLSDSFDAAAFGWGDHSKKYVLIDETASSLFACLKCIESKFVLPDILRTHMEKIISFLIGEQNEDGGWGLGKGDDSRIQFTFWVLKSLRKAQDILPNFVQNPIFMRALNNGKSWLQKNLESNNNQGFSIVIGSNIINAFATAYGVEISFDLHIPINNKEIIKYLSESQTKRGEWDTPVDAISYGAFPRRVYNFADYPRIIEALILLGSYMKSDLFQFVLNTIKKLEFPEGGFKHQTTDQKPVGWFTCQVIKMFSSVINVPDSTVVELKKEDESALCTKLHAFRKAVLMIGRFQPPHLGHYNGLRAILEGNVDEFYLPEEALKEFLSVDQIFIGVARSNYDKENPFPIGAIKDIWRQIIDGDTFLRKHSNIITIESCPAEKNLINVKTAVLEITSREKRISIISGNQRIIAQCKNSGINYLTFKRNPEISGSKIRDLISRIDFERYEENRKEKETLKMMLHPKAFEFMASTDLFLSAQKILNAK